MKSLFMKVNTWRNGSLWTCCGVLSAIQNRMMSFFPASFRFGIDAGVLWCVLRVQSCRGTIIIFIMETRHLVNCNKMHIDIVSNSIVLPSQVRVRYLLTWGYFLVRNSPSVKRLSWAFGSPVIRPFSMTQTNVQLHLQPNQDVVVYPVNMPWAAGVDSDPRRCR